MNWVMSWFYIFQDPMGSDDCKVGITSNPEVRLGQYQNSYSSRSHLAQFDIIYVGESHVIANLEKAVKTLFDWDIEHNGRGFTEWVSHHTAAQIEAIVDEIIDGYKFRVTKISKELMPVNVHNVEEIMLLVFG